MDIEIAGSFLITKHVAPLMIRGGGGRIIYLSSVIGTQPGPGAAPYGGAKAAINILANVVHQELSGDGIQTVAIAPGLTDTPGMRAIVGEEYIARVAGQYPGGRVGQPEDIVALTAFLCSDAASHLSGTVITVRPPAYR
jgi:NAD(P)-dependent dehydrogenase (short-subunit alcohol dehydrogenase family)